MARATAVVVYLLVGRFGGVPSPELGPPEGGGERTGNFRVGPREDRNGGGGRLSFPDFSRRFFASLAEKIYTFSLSILLMFTVSLIPCCGC